MSPLPLPYGTGKDHTISTLLSMLYVSILSIYVVKLTNYLHFLDSTGLSTFLESTAKISPELDKTSLLALSNLLLEKTIKDIETFSCGRCLLSIFWSSGKLCISLSEGESLSIIPDVVVVSALVGSLGANRLIAAGCEPRAHPYSYSPEWTKCFVFKNNAVAT